MFVRTAGERDLAAIQMLLAEAWHAARDPIHGAERVAAMIAQRHAPTALREMLARDRSEFIVADDGKQIAGAAYATASGDDARIVTLHELAVRPGLEGKGIGGMLLHEIEGSFFESELIRVEIEEPNARVVAFFQGEGYLRTGRCDATASQPVAILSLQKSLLSEP